MVGDSSHSRRLQSLQVTLIRHGQSVDNLTNVWAGHKDSPLTATGLAQARALADSFAQVHIDAIYASDLKRASQTAHEVLNANRSIPPPLLVQTQSLREQHFGVAEGRDWTEAEWNNPNRGKGAAARELSFPEGESLEAVNARLTTAIRRFILPRLEALRGPEPWLGPPPHIVIVAHGISIAEILRVLMSYHDIESSFPAPWPHPALSYKRVRLDNTGWTRLQLSVPFSPSPSSAEAAELPAAGSPSISTIKNGKTDSDASPPTLPAKVPAPVSSADGGKTIQSAAEGEATATPTDPPSLISQLPKPPRKDIFVKFVGHQNSIDHLAGFATSGGIGSAANILGGGAPPGSDGQRETGVVDRTKDMKNNGRTAAGGSAHRADGTSRTLHHTQGSYSSSVMSQILVSGREAERKPSPQSERSPSGKVTGTHNLPMTLPSAGSGLFALGRNARKLTFPAPAHTLQAPGASSDAWKGICAKILPLFGSEGLKSPVESVEDINESVSLHVRRTLDRGPARAWNSLTLDLKQLIGTGLLTLDNRVGNSVSPSTSSERQLLSKLADSWTAFSQILPWVEAAFLPLATDPVLLSLASGSAATNRGLPPQGVSASDSHHHPSVTSSSSTNHQQASLLRSQPVDVKKLGLSVFRDSLVLPHFEVLFQSFAKLGEIGPTAPRFPHEQHLGTGRSVPAPILPEEDPALPSSSLFTRLTQMVHILRSVQSGDDAQQGIDVLLRALRVGTSRENVASTAAGIAVHPLGPGQGRGYDRGARQGFVGPSPSSSRHTALSECETNALGTTGMSNDVDTATGNGLSSNNSSSSLIAQPVTTTSTTVPGTGIGTGSIVSPPSSSSRSLSPLIAKQPLPTTTTRTEEESHVSPPPRRVGTVAGTLSGDDPTSTTVEMEEEEEGEEGEEEREVRRGRQVEDVGISGKDATSSSSSSSALTSSTTAAAATAGTGAAAIPPSPRSSPSHPFMNQDPTPTPTPLRGGSATAAATATAATSSRERVSKPTPATSIPPPFFLGAT